MGLYDGIREVAKLIQQSGNLELYHKLLDLSSEALDLQEKVSRLKEENELLKKKKAIDDDIVYHVDPFLTRKSDNGMIPIRYCAACWAGNEKLVPMQLYQDEYGKKVLCPLCKARVYIQFD